MNTPQTFAEACRELQALILDSSPVDWVLKKALWAAAVLTGAQLAVFQGVEEVPEHVRKLRRELCESGKAPHYPDSLLETELRAGRPWKLARHPGDGNGTPPSLSIVIGHGGRAIGVFGLTPCPEDALADESSREALLSILSQATASLRAATDAQRIAELEAEVRESKNRAVVDRPKRNLLPAAQRIIGESPAICALRKLIERAAASNASVVITGARGTGKELVARAIHDQSSRAAGPFQDINAGAMSEDLTENEMVGHKRGSYTGADRDKPGLLELADGGTFFLDEFGEISHSFQVKLLRILQTRTVRRIGCDVRRSVDFRLIAATNRDLAELIRDGLMREDFLDRVNVLKIHLPPLRDRREDIPLLIAHFLRTAPGRWVPPSAPPPTISREAVDFLCGLPWPGNVRELESVLERAIALDGSDLVLESFRYLHPGSPPPAPSDSLRQRVYLFTRVQLQGYVDGADGSLSQAARNAREAKETFRQKCLRHGVEAARS